jgi:hypothetical protein
MSRRQRNKPAHLPKGVALFTSAVPQGRGTVVCVCVCVCVCACVCVCVLTCGRATNLILTVRLGQRFSSMEKLVEELCQKEATNIANLIDIRDRDHLSEQTAHFR